MIPLKPDAQAKGVAAEPSLARQASMLHAVLATVARVPRDRNDAGFSAKCLSRETRRPSRAC